MLYPSDIPLELTPFAFEFVKNAKVRSKRWIYRLEAWPVAKNSARTPAAVRIMISYEAQDTCAC